MSDTPNIPDLPERRWSWTVWRQLAIAYNWPILLAVAVLSAVGVLTIWAHAASEARTAGDARKQLLFVGLGMLCMFLLQSVSYQRIARLAWLFYALSLGAIVYTIMPGVPTSGFLGVPEVNGARAWINFGILSFQPAELTKISFCMVLSHYLRFRSNYRTLAGLLPPFALALIPVFLILRQPDLGTALVFFPALLIMLFCAGARKSHLAAVVGMGLVFAPIAWYAGPKEKTGLSYEVPILKKMPALVKRYQRARVYAMFSNDPAVLREAGFQQEQALIAFGSGGAAGRGLGNVAVGRTVPEAHNDMIFALIGEQFGFIGAAVLIGAYLVLFAWGIEIASITREPFGRLMAIGIVSLLAGQTFLNLMVTIRMMPVTGITLPFVSYGGSSMLASYIAAGFLLNISQNRPVVMARDSFEFD